MPRLRGVPLAINLYIAGFFLLVWAPIPFDNGKAPAGLVVLSFLLTLIPFFFLLRGSRIAWVVLLLVEILALAFNLVSGSRWLVPFALLFIALLLAPLSRSFVWQGRTDQKI